MATERAFVLDTSVAVKWYLSEDLEPGQRQARDVLRSVTEGSIRLHGPELIRYEVGNVLARRVKQPERGFKEFLALPLHIHSLDVPLHERTLALQIERRILYYDAAYLALAEKLGVSVLTDDQQLIRASRGHALALTNFTPPAPDPWPEERHR